jgi:predicted small lipoprotein YifL
MKFWSTTLAALFALTLITGCGPKEEAPADDAMTSEEAAPMEEAPAADSGSTEPGGYEPTPEERVPPAESGS